jgi:hypothetical protein
MEDVREWIRSGYRLSSKTAAGRYHRIVVVTRPGSVHYQLRESKATIVATIGRSNTKEEATRTVDHSIEQSLLCFASVGGTNGR